MSIRTFHHAPSRIPNTRNKAPVKFHDSMSEVLADNPSRHFPELDSFLNELETLCGKHGVLLIHMEDAIHIQTGKRELGRLLYICKGRVGFSPTMAQGESA